MVEKYQRSQIPETNTEAARIEQIDQVINYLREKKYPMDRNTICKNARVPEKSFTKLVNSSTGIHAVPIPHHGPNSNLRYYTDDLVKSVAFFKLYNRIKEPAAEVFNNLVKKVKESATASQQNPPSTHLPKSLKAKLKQEIYDFIQSQASNEIKAAILEYVKILQHKGYTLIISTIFNHLLNQVDSDLQAVAGRRAP